MTDYKIDKGIPIPKRKVESEWEFEGSNKELLLAMQPLRDSKFFANATVSQVTNRFFNTAKNNGMKIVVRKVDGGARMWRTV